MTGRFVVNPQYDQGNAFDEGYASFANGGKWGFIDTKGQEVCAAKFLAVGNFSDGLAPAQTEDGWGFIDRTCKSVVSAQFDGAESFQNGLAHVTALGKEAYVTTAGSFVVNPFPGTTVLAEKARRAAEAADAAAKAAQAVALANAEAADAAAKAAQAVALANAEAADAAAKAAQVAALANAANRSRVEQGIAGEWAGKFNNDPRGRLAITRAGGVIGATLVSGGWREAFNGELLPDGTLVLTGTGATRVGTSSSSTYSLDTLRLELDTNRVNLSGQYRDAQGHTGRVVFAKLAR
jgi:nucleoid-associated protein YgaU